MWIDNCNGKIDLSLRRMNKFKKEFNQNYKVIHVGGTNGKGSVCNFIAGALSKNYKVGLYTSPHLERVNERIKINGKEISNREIEEFNYFSKYNFTYFEGLTAMALKYFEKKKVNFAVIEVGLGGRLDATNIVEPYITIITNVFMEHTQWLGNSIEDIAKEKAGIIKNSPVVTGCKGRALDIIKKIAKDKKIDLYVEGKNFKWKRDGKKFIIESDGKYILEPKMNALYQGSNIAIAIKALELIGIEKEDIINGIENIFIPARMEKIGKFIIDGAHNPHGIEAFSMALKEIDYENIIIIFGAMKDKNVKKMIELLPKSKAMIATKVKNKRAMEPKRLKELYDKFIPSKDVLHAIKIAEKLYRENDIIAIVGSLYLAGEVRKILFSL